MTKNDSRGIIKLIPAAFVLGYIPLIVHLHVYDSRFEDFSWFPAWEDGMMYDLFLYFKAAAVVITAAVMLLIILSEKEKGSWRQDIKKVIFLLIYLGLVLISGLLSSHRQAAFFGSAESFESVLVILSYGVFFFYSHRYVRDGEGLGTVLKLSLPGFALMSVISVMQLLKTDPFNGTFLKKIIIAEKYSDLREGLVFHFWKGDVYGTLYSPNYVAMYFGFGLFIGLAIVLCKNLSKKARTAGFVTALISALCIIGSRSKTGILAAGISLIFFSLTKIKKRAVRMIGISVVFAGVAAALLTIGFTEEKGEKHLIEDVKTEKDGVEVMMKGNTLFISYKIKDGEFFVDLKSNSESVDHKLSDDGQVYIVFDDRFSGMEISPVFIENEAAGTASSDPDTDELLCMKVKADGRELVFWDPEDERGYLYYNAAGKFADFHTYSKISIFPDSLFTDRGLLWNNCISLIPKCIFRGSGAGTLVYVYPNDDDLARLYNDSGVNYYDVKAHSLYFQQIIENGLPSLICLLIFIAGYLLIPGYRSLLSSSDVQNESIQDNLRFCVRNGIFFGMICYLLCAFTVDSNVTTAPVFWVLLGCI